MSNATIKCT